VMSNQRPNSAVEFKHTAKSKKETIQFDHQGICDACRVTEDKNTTVDWESREQELRELCDRHRREDGRYDCVLPGSGGKDSFYASHIIKNKYGMHPLTVTWAPHIYTEWGWRNFQRWIGAGFDNYLMTPNTRVHRLLTRLATDNLLHPFQPFILGQKNLAPKMSAFYDIPLVFFGESETEYGNPKADGEKAQREWRYFTTEDKSEVFLGGTSVADLKEGFGLTENDLDAYYPANPERLKAVNTEIHYLGYYLKWHPQGCYYYAQEHGDFEPSPERTPGTYSKYNSIDDRIDDLFYYTMHIKFGIGRATTDSAQEIRSSDIVREEAVSLVKRFDGEFPDRFADELFKYLSVPEEEFAVASKMFEQPIMDREYFDALCDGFRSPHLWKYENQEWSLRHPVWRDAP
jgi:N-acetyl sugar amidotransferase